MPNAAAVIPLTFDGNDIQRSDFGIFLEIVRGLNEKPRTRGEDQIVPGAEGRVVRNRITDTIVVELRGFVAGVGADETAARSNFRTRVKEVRTWFDPALPPAPLSATLEDTVVATVDLRTVSLVWDQQLPSFARVSIELESVDPVWAV